MSRLFPALLLVAALAGVSLAEPPKEPEKKPADAPPPDPTAMPIIRMASKAPLPSHTLKYLLLPDPADLTPGNAASLWRRAYQVARDVKAPMLEKEYKWSARGETALEALPRKEVREYLDKVKIVLRLCDEAARRAFCDWDYPPLTMQTVAEGLPLGEVQMAREMANLLKLRFRLQLAEGKFDDAIVTLQTGFALARHLGEGQSLIQNLVSVAIAAVMLGNVEELMEQPNAPNLYWALTALPSPFIDARKSAEHELGTFLRSFPQLREADKAGMTAAQAQKLADDVFGAIAELSSPDVGDLPGKLAASLIVPMYLAQAKKELIAHGRNKEDVEAMPGPQVVLVWFHEDYVRERDDILKWFLLPPWQTLPGLEELDKKEKEARKNVAGTMILQGGWALRQLTPAILKVFDANLRIQRYIAAFRTVEAIRLYATNHDGKLPQALKDVTEVPLPLDPRTGKGFDEFYKVDGDKGVLEVPAPPGMPPLLGRRFELTRSK